MMDSFWRTQRTECSMNLTLTHLHVYFNRIQFTISPDNRTYPNRVVRIPHRDSSTYYHSGRMLERAETNVYDVCSLSRWQKQRPEPGVSQWNIPFPSSTKAT